jgi:AraC-like DNA-binding protein
MVIDRHLRGRVALRMVVGARRPHLLLVDGDLGRRATLGVALSTRYTVSAAANGREAYTHATLSPFDLAVLDAAVLDASLPRLVRVLRARSRAVRLVIVTGRRDLRGRHYAATLGIEAKLGRPAPACALLDRIDRLAGAVPRGAGFDGGVGRAIDLMARDVTHLLDVNVLAHTTGVSLPALCERFLAATGLTVHEYVTRVRVEVAEQLLRDTDLGLATLADLLGFAGAAALAHAAAVSRLAP